MLGNEEISFKYNNDYYGASVNNYAEKSRLARNFQYGSDRLNKTRYLYIY